MRRLLVIRGGAIGDFVLTLPGIAALRNEFAGARLEILGYKHIVALAEERFYADATRSIEYGALAGFFGKGADLSAELCDYFRSFDLIVSYLFDPDGNFERNLRRCGVEKILACSPKLTGAEHAALQLARPLQELGLAVSEAGARLYPSPNDRASAAAFLGHGKETTIALHPGSGSERKNWAVENWIALTPLLLDRRPSVSLLFVGGESDRERLVAIRARVRERVRIAENLALPHLAAVLEKCALFLGHDSGISHIAAAVDTPCVLLFGPSEPEVWAPANKNVRVIRAPGGDLTKLGLSAVASAADQELMRIGINT